MLFYIGRWVGRVEQRLENIEKGRAEDYAAIRKEREDGDAAVRALVNALARQNH